MGRWGLIAALCLGALLRLLWGDDIEYKGDEAFTFTKTMAYQTSGEIPAFGMKSSAGPLNPGMSLWIFLGLGKIFGVSSPPDLSRAVAVCAILAMFLFLPFIRWCIAEQERESWSWGLAFMAVNPLAVLWQRKIWPPSLFPLFTLGFLLGWWKRDRFWGACLFGCFGALLGQIHMPGFFLAAGFALWAFLFDRQGTRWLGWLFGSVLGVLPLVPWLHYLLFDAARSEQVRGVEWLQALRMMFWFRWTTESLGLTLWPSMGRDFLDWLRHPLIAGTPTYFVLLAHASLAISLVTVLAIGAKELLKRRESWRTLMIGRSDATAFTLAAAWWGYGLLLTLSLRPIHWYYHIGTLPLLFVWLARWILNWKDCDGNAVPTRRTILFGICVLQAGLSLSFLTYIHALQRPCHGDFGSPYRLQIQPLSEP